MALSSPARPPAPRWSSPSNLSKSSAAMTRLPKSIAASLPDSEDSHYVAIPDPDGRIPAGGRVNRRSITAIALTVAGSDSGGGAGIQADLKTFHALGVFGTSAITCITAQNPDRVSAVQALAPRLVAEQMDRIFEAFPIGAAKTGMLYDAAIITTVARSFARRQFHRAVVDPVTAAS